MKCCVICFKKNSPYNYGVNSCNACTMFYRRVLAGKRCLQPCEFQGSCFQGSPPSHPKCRMCRFEKCINSGMKLFHSTVTHSLIRNDTNTSLSSLISDLEYRDEERNKTYLNSYLIPTNDPSILEILEDPGLVKLALKEDRKLSFEEWTQLCQVVNIQLLRNYDFMKLLDISDQLVVIKAVKMQFGILKSAVTALKSKRSRLTYPDGTDFLQIETGFEWEKELRFRLLEKLKEMDIQNEEFLLMSMVMLSNPAIPKLSDYARNILSSYQSQFSSALFQWCRLKYQEGGPSKFTDILSLFHVLSNAYQYMEMYCFWIKYTYPDVTVNKLCADSFK